MNLFSIEFGLCFFIFWPIYYFLNTRPHLQKAVLRKFDGNLKPLYRREYICRVVCGFGYVVKSFYDFVVFDNQSLAAVKFLAVVRGKSLQI